MRALSNLFLCAATSLVGCARTGNGGDDAAPVLRGFVCPTTTDGWRDWARGEFGTLAAFGYTNNARYVYETLTKCEAELATLPEASGELRNLGGFARAAWLERQPGHTLAQDVADRAYLEQATPAGVTDVPQDLQDPTFLQALDAADLAAAYAHLDQRGYTYLRFSSQHLPSPDESATRDRLLVLALGEGVERFVQFALSEPEKPAAESVSVVGVVGSAAYFNDWFRIRGNGPIALATRLDRNEGVLENCTRCHRTALLPVRPAPGTFDAARFGAALTTVNAAIRRHAGVQIPHFALDRDGPPVGLWNTEDLADDALAACRGDAFPGDLARLRGLLSCASCHDGVNRGTLSLASLADAQLPGGGSLVQRYVVDYEAMPPGAQLTRSEREAVHRCLTQRHATRSLEAPGPFERWLLPIP